MSIESIINNNQLSSLNANKTNNVLGKDDFLKLMLIQMRNQDPLNPMDNQQMLSQMAQFSSLEQMTNLNKNFDAANKTDAFMNATRLLGKIVHINNPGNALAAVSSVKSISFSPQGPVLSLSNGQTVSIEQILKVEEATE